MKAEVRQTIIQDLEMSTSLDPDVVGYFRALLAQGKVVRDEGGIMHLCSYFSAYNPETGKILISHHLKSGLWLIPGGHVDVDELPRDTVVREWQEELGSTITDDDVNGPFYISHTPIVYNPKQPTCVVHYDVWFYVNTDASDFNIAQEELGEVRWVTFEEAHELVTDGNTRKALRVLESLVSNHDKS